MAGVTLTEVPPAGFSFDLCNRNKLLEKSGIQLPNSVKTGTTIAGILFKDGVVLGADTRATEGTVVADKNCAKIHYIAPNIYCCGAGTAADTENVTELISSNLELHRLSTGRISRVSTACRMLKQYLFRYQGYISAALVLGGVDSTGSYLYTVYPHGSTDKLPYVTMGSGSLAAMAVFESRYRPNMEVDEAKQLVRDAIAGGIFNDLGSGSNVDLCVIAEDKKQFTTKFFSIEETELKTEYLRPFETPNEKGKRSKEYKYEKGTTAVLDTKVRKFVVTSETVSSSTEAMET